MGGSFNLAENPNSFTGDSGVKSDWRTKQGGWLNGALYRLTKSNSLLLRGMVECRLKNEGLSGRVGRN